MTKIIVDDTEIEVSPELTILQACEEAGAEIPRFCFHERLSIAGNCRMCLVEVKGAPKPVASCAMNVRDLRPGPEGQPPVVFTRTPLVKKAREGVMEFLLINHPLDCPICDQGGECDLQDQAMAYGVDSSRFHENKRAVEDKYIGPLVKTIMTRCIHCTRCIRFATEVAGVPELGAIGRGEDMEITTYLESAMTSELQGNVIDLCPVGALTSAPYAFQARPWELNKTESIDVMDALCANIRVDSRDTEVMRILPRTHEEVNEEWISDKSRFVWDGIRSQRLDRPYLRENGRLRPASWPEAFAAIAERVKASGPERIGAIAGDLAGVEEMFALKDLMGRLGTGHIDCRQDGARLDPALGRASYLFNATVAGIEDADAILIVGSNPRLECPVLNARIRKTWLASGGAVPVGLVLGDQPDLTYPYQHLGAGPDSLAGLTGSKDFGKALKQAARPLIVVGQGALAREDGAAVMAEAARLAREVGAVAPKADPDWNGLSILHTAAARVGGLDIGFVPGTGGRDVAAMLAPGALDIVYLLGADEITVPEGPFVIYQGSHGDRGAHRADVILPGAAFTEKSATFVNTEGRVQVTRRSVFPPGDAREDWAILRALSDPLGHKLPYDSLAALRAALYEAHPHLAALDGIAPGEATAADAAAERRGKLAKLAFKSTIEDFYLSNAVARASTVMAQLSAMALERQTLEAAE